MIKPSRSIIFIASSLLIARVVASVLAPRFKLCFG